MLLSDLFTNLSYGPLAGLSVGGSGSGTIPPANESKFVAYTNSTLTNLFSRFLILEDELIIDAQDNITTYELRDEYTVSSNTLGNTLYIRDTVQNPFVSDRLLKITKVYDEEGTEIPLNDTEDDASFYTPAFDTLQIPEPVTGNSYIVMYQSKHPKLVVGDLSQEIRIPALLGSALEAHVAHKIFASMNGAEHLAQSDRYLMKYEMICNQVLEGDFANTSRAQQNDRFTARGWV